MHTATLHAYGLNPHARDWSPEAEKRCAAVPSGLVAPFPPPPGVRPPPAADVSGSPLRPWMQQAWMTTMQMYHNFWYYWHTYYYGWPGPSGGRNMDYMPPPTVAALWDAAPRLREAPTNTNALETGSGPHIQKNFYNNLTPMQKTNFLPPPLPTTTTATTTTTNSFSPELFSHKNAGNGNTIDSCHRGILSPSSSSSCLLCGKVGHCYTACRLFDGKTVCFVYSPDSTVYAMRHDHWVERAILQDVYSFIRLAMGLLPQKVVLSVGPIELTVDDFPPATRCCDLQILPGAVVCVSMHQNLPRSGIVAPWQLHDNKLTPISKKRGRPEQARDAEEAFGDEMLGEVSTIPRTSELSVSLPQMERQKHFRGDTVMEDISGVAISDNEAENSVFTKHTVTAPPSPERPCNTNTENLTNVSSPLALLVGSTLVPTLPDPAVIHSVPSRTTVPNTSGGGSCDKDMDWLNALRRKGNPCKTQLLTSANTEKGAAPPLSQASLAPLNETGDGDDSDGSRRCRTVHVRFMPVSMSFLEIRKLLWSRGEVHKVRLVKPSVTTNPCRMFYVCFVEYATKKGAEEMIKLQGYRLGDSFRLAVEPSRHPIRGGYLTDRDAETGRPCTFGLDEAERKALEKRYAKLHRGGDGGRGGGEDDDNNNNNNNDNNNNDCDHHVGEVSRGGGGKNSPQRRGSQRHRVSNSSQDSPATISPTTAFSVSNPDCAGNGGAGDMNAKCVASDNLGPYALQIVATVNSQSRTRCAAAAAASRRVGAVSGDGSKTVTTLSSHSNSPLATMAAVTAFPPPVSRDLATCSEQMLRNRLLSATTLFVQQTTPRTFFETLKVLEDIKWCPVTAVFRLVLLRFEVALFLYYDFPQTAENAMVVATRAIHWTNELTQLLVDIAGNTARLSPTWRPLFTSVPPAQQRYKARWEDYQEDDEEQFVGGEEALRLYPSCGKILRFVELVLHIILLLDECQQSNNNRKKKKRDVSVAALLHSAALARTSRMCNIAQEMLACACRLLTQLRVELSTEDGLLSSEVPVWRSKISHILELLPFEADWNDGGLLGLLLPGTEKLLATTLTSQVELRLF